MTVCVALGVPRAVCKVQLSASHGTEALGVLPPAREVSLRVLLLLLRENESPVLKLFFRGSVLALSPARSHSSISRSLTGEASLACSRMCFHSPAVTEL